MKVVQTIELNEEERQIVVDFITLMDKIVKIMPSKSVTDVAAYFCENADWSNEVWQIDEIHQIDEIKKTIG